MSRPSIVSGRSYSAAAFVGIGLLAAMAAACSSTDSKGGDSTSPTPDAAAPLPDASEGRVTQTGKVIDYDTGHPMEGFTVTDGDQTATTDATGVWSLSRLKGSTLSPMIVGPSYTQLFLPDVVADNDFDRGVTVIASADTFHFAQGVLGNDTSMAVVYILAELAPTCASAAGATLTVLSPAGTTVRYFSPGGLPLTSMTAFADIKPPNPSAVIYDVTPGEDIVFTVDHPTCKQVPYPAAIKGGLFTGHVTTRASVDGDSNSALHVALE